MTGIILPAQHIHSAETLDLPRITTPSPVFSKAASNTTSPPFTLPWKHSERLLTAA